MLASDLIVDVRASRTITAEQIDKLERAIFAGDAPGAELLDLLQQIEAYVERAAPGWPALLARAAAARSAIHADKAA